MEVPIHVLGFSGSLRRGSYNSALLRAAAELLPEGMSLEIFDLSPLPLYNADVEAVGLPGPVQIFQAKIAAAGAVLIACPEYNYSITGVLKNALDWASRPPARPLNGKPAAVMGAGGRFGAARAQLHLHQIAVYLNLMLLHQPPLLIPNAWEKFDDQGRLIDATVRQELRALLEALATWTRQLKEKV